MPAEAVLAGGSAARPATTEAERARRQALRIAIAAAAGMAAMVAAGSMMPFLAPLFAAQFLVAGRGPMKPAQAIGMAVVIVATGQAVALAVGVLGDRPAVFLPLLWLLYLACFLAQCRGRGGQAAFLVLVVAVIVPLMEMLHRDLGESLMAMLAGGVVGGALLAWAGNHDLGPGAGARQDVDVWRECQTRMRRQLQPSVDATLPGGGETMTSRAAKKAAMGSGVAGRTALRLRITRRAVLLPAAFLLLIGGCDEKEQASSQPSAQQPAPTVVVVPASRQPVTQAAEFVGRVEALEKVEIRARVTGFLRDRHFQEGQVVQEGALLFTIEREPFEADVAAKQAKIESAQAELANATYQVERGRELIRTNTIPRATLDQRVAEYGVAAAAVSGARADLGLAQINLGYTEIRSPIAGRVGRAAITRGNVVGPEAGVLTVVVRQDPIRVTFPVSQRQLLDLRRQYEGQGMDAVRVRVRLPDGLLYPESGRVNFIDVRTDRATDTALVQAEIANPANILSDGQFVGIQVEGKEPQQAVVIPQSAVQIDQAGPFVLVVGEGNKVEQRRIRLGRGPSGQSVVESGLEPGTLVVTEGAQRARPGAVVAPRPASGDLPAAGPIPAQAG